MGKTAGFLEYERKTGPVREPAKRLGDFKEFHGMLSMEEGRQQAGRCMDCGIPFCQSGVMLAGMASGCPLNNLVPECNDLLWRGRPEEAWRRLSITHSFPEFTARVCPALCEAACACGLHDEPVSTKENERRIIEYAFANGLVKEPVPPCRTGKRIVVIGSGPSGLAAAQLLNRRGHLVTVFERSDRPGGLLRYGIPNMKLDKSVIDRRIRLMEQAGIVFRVNTDVGRDIDVSALREEYDAILLACGASKPRDLAVPGREAKGIRFAVDFLGEVTKTLPDSGLSVLPEKEPAGVSASTEASETAVSRHAWKQVSGKHVLVIGGGDTGNDCVGTCLRLGAKSVVQLEMMPQPPIERTPDNPWPEWPKVLKTDYGQEEAIFLSGQDPRLYQTTVKEFRADKRGNLKSVVLISLKAERDARTGRLSMQPVEGTEKEIPAQLALIAAGFLGMEDYVAEAFGIERDGRGNVKTAPGDFASSGKGIYAAGDAHRGQSLVVWAIAEGRKAARQIDEELMGYSAI